MEKLIKQGNGGKDVARDHLIIYGSTCIQLNMPLAGSQTIVSFMTTQLSGFDTPAR